jgi:autotransporter family porin
MTGKQTSRRDASKLPRFALFGAIMIMAGAVGSFGAGDQADVRYFPTLPPGSALPSGAACAEQVRRSPWEPRPDNSAANQMLGTRGVRVDGADHELGSEIAQRIDGDFTGTTDEILQWGACKWGFDENITRARAVQESSWRQAKQSDDTNLPRLCAVIGKGAPCPQSYGILQVKGTVHNGTYPLAERSTAFNVDYAMGWLRDCYEGAFSHWLGYSYRAGDEWGCVGAWYSGQWHDDGAKEYIEKVKRILEQQVWRNPDF